MSQINAGELKHSGAVSVTKILKMKNDQQEITAVKKKQQITATQKLKVVATV